MILDALGVSVLVLGVSCGGSGSSDGGTWCFCGSYKRF